MGTVRADQPHTIEIQGREYDGTDLWDYLEEHKAEFTEQAVLKEITEIQMKEQEAFGAEGMPDHEFTVVEDNPILFHGRKEIYQGNALFMAIQFKKYELAQTLIEQTGFIRDGSYVTVYRMENAEPLMISPQVINLLSFLLEDEEMPEELWMKIWGYYREKRRIALQVSHASQAKIRLWISNLKKIKANRPQFFEKIVNERFLLELLWCYSAGSKWESPKNVKQFCREWKKCLPVPKDGTMCRSFLLKELANILTREPAKESELPRTICFADLWKRISGQRFVIDFSDPKMAFVNDTYGNTCKEEILDALCTMADEVKHAEHVNWNGIFRYAVQEEKRFKMALEKNLITKKMLPVALDYLKKNHQELIALLFLKQHGEL